MKRAYVSVSAADVPSRSDHDFLGRLTAGLPFSVEQTQRAAWDYQVQHLRAPAHDLPEAHFFLEFLIPRMGRRADLVVHQAGIVFVVEYKLGAAQFDSSSLAQTYGYGLDLKNFHETSHAPAVVPILVATAAKGGADNALHWGDDGLAQPLRSAPASWVG
jgi:hypothetical protein